MMTSAILGVFVCMSVVWSATLPAFHRHMEVFHHSPNHTTVRTNKPVPAANVAEWRERILESRAILAKTRYGKLASARLEPDDFFKWIPAHITNLKDGKAAHWGVDAAPNMCFRDVSMEFRFTGRNTGVIEISMNDKVDWTCADLYLIAGVDTFHVHDFLLSGKSRIELENMSPIDIRDLQTNGLRVLHFPYAVLQDVVDFWETVRLFLYGFWPFGPASVPKETADLNRKFLKDHMDIDMPPRKVNNIGFNASYVKSGDFFGIIRLDGLDPMIAWGEGAHTGHTVTALEIDGTMYIVESQTGSHYWPKNNIQRTPFDEWIQLAEKASFNVVHLPLNARARARFNQTAAVEFFLSVEGVPYGFNNFLFGWIDSAEGNFPPPLSSQTVMILFAILQHIDNSITDTFWNQALNHRLGTKGLNCYEAYAKAAEMNITFGELISIPEQDSWLYTQPAGGGWNKPTQPIPAMVCDVFVCRVAKAAGLFGDIADKINCAEFSNWDVYSLNFYDGHPDRPEICKQADPENPLCQILGEYSLILNLAGTVAPYPHMREHCAGISPNYYWQNNTC